MRRLLAFVFLFLLMSGAALCGLVGDARADERRIPLDHPFALVDAEGHSVTSNGFPGRWLLIYFGYTHCADQCPTALSTIVEALDELGPAAAQVQPLFVTVDPERDRGPMLRSFTAAFDARIIGLTGSSEQIADAAGMLGIEYNKVFAGSDDYVIDHSTTLSVVGPDRKTAITFAMAEPYQITAKLFELLQQGGVALGAVNNLGAYR
ncbi:MAG: SCO family protein [Alphaproteobacteria bacterium]|nr:SCO family protein [Alphaproteobacteria bacterium]